MNHETPEQRAANRVAFWCNLGCALLFLAFALFLLWAWFVRGT